MFVGVEMNNNAAVNNITGKIPMATTRMETILTAGILTDKIPTGIVGLKAGILTGKTLMDKILTAKIRMVKIPMDKTRMGSRNKALGNSRLRIHSRNLARQEARKTAEATGNNRVAARQNRTICLIDG